MPKERLCITFQGRHYHKVLPFLGTISLYRAPGPNLASRADNPRVPSSLYTTGWRHFWINVNLIEYDPTSRQYVNPTWQGTYINGSLPSWDIAPLSLVEKKIICLAQIINLQAEIVQKKIKRCERDINKVRKKINDEIVQTAIFYKTRIKVSDKRRAGTNALRLDGLKLKKNILLAELRNVVHMRKMIEQALNPSIDFDPPLF